jgi:hypothetical protein
VTVNCALPNGHAGAGTSQASLLRADLVRIAERFAEADRRAWEAATTADREGREAAEDERREAAGAFWAAGRELAELLLLLLRHAADHQPDAVRAYLADMLRPELEPLARAIARLEGRP